jgi:colanic acid/amylovoran biosynthesis protein
MATFFIANLWHDDNRGDAAIAIGTAGLLRARYPGCHIRFASVLSDQSGMRHVRTALPGADVVPPLVSEMPTGSGWRDHLALAGWSLRVVLLAVMTLTGHVPRRLAAAIGDADAVVLVGGSNLFDTGTGFGVSSVRLLQFALPGFAAEAMDRQVWVLGHTLGPFESRIGRRTAARLLRRADHVVLREEFSMPVARSLGAGHPVVAADMAFAVDPDLSPRVARVLVTAGLCPGGFAVLTVRHSPYGGAATDDRLVAELAATARGLIADGVVAKVAVVVHTSGPTPVEDDRMMSARVVDAASTGGQDDVVLVDADLSPAELAALYGEARLVIGERLHSVILALRAGTPAFAISYFTTKAPGVMAACGLPDMQCAVADVTSARLRESARRLCQPEVRGLVRARVAELRARLHEVVA